MALVSDADLDWLRQASRAKCQDLYAEIWKLNDWPLVADLGRKDRFFLLTHVLNRVDADRDWIYERCREVEADPYGYLDLWAREHYKSTIITFAGIIQEIVRDPEVTVGIFSHNNRKAQEFLEQIKVELEANPRLKAAYPEIMWRKPDREAPRWSIERGIVVKRKGNPKEATVQAHGLVDGMPTGSHFRRRYYDDIVTQDSVTTPEQMKKTTTAWELSQFLGTMEGEQVHVGTIYHFNDTHRELVRRGVLKVRKYPATDDGTPGGKPVLLGQKRLDEIRRSSGSYVFACQMLLDPVADEAQGFKREWLRYHNGVTPDGMNVYMLVDPANEKKKESDYTAAFVLALGADRNIYVLEMARERMNLAERADLVFDLHAEFRPKLVGYEKYGKDSDIQHFEDRMRRDNYRFSVVPLGGTVKKEDRIRRLVPLFEEGRIWLPEALFRDSDGRRVDLVRTFIEDEYMAFPVGLHDDMLDCLARIVDPEFPILWPKGQISDAEKRRRGDYDFADKRPSGTWMSA